VTNVLSLEENSPQRTSLSNLLEIHEINFEENWRYRTLSKLDRVYSPPCPWDTHYQFSIKNSTLKRFLTLNRGPGYVKDADFFSHLPWQTRALIFFRFNTHQSAPVPVSAPDLSQDLRRGLSDQS